jgi:hypothetical protein
MRSINSVFSGLGGAFQCSGNIDNPMFQNIKTADGIYIPQSSRNSKRYLARLRKKSVSLTRIKANSPNRSGKGFGI